MQMMVAIEDLLPEVMRFARAVPEPVAIAALRDAARKLCKAAAIWRETDTFPISSPEFEGICTLEDAAIVSIEQAFLDDAALEPQTLDWLDRNRRGWGKETADSGPARFITQLSPNTVTIVPKVSGTLMARLVLQPSRTAMSFPEFLVSDFGNELGRGAAGQILITPGAEYANPQLGSGLITEFDRKCSSAKFTAAKGQQGARTRTRASYF